MNKYVINFSFLITITIIVYSCQSIVQDKNSVKEDRQTRIKFRQYLAEGKILYDIHCANCHQEDGSGLAMLYPPLRNSDFMRDNKEAVICQIRNGVEGEMIVNGISFNMPMPGNSSLTNLEIAQVVTYIYNEWGKERSIVSIEFVIETLAECP